MKHITLLSDNARCYQNDLLPVMAPFIADHHDFVLDTFVHSETQRGKSLVDAHFAIAMMHVNRYCNMTRKDITTPGDVVEALNSNEGVANCTAEMIHIRRKNQSLQAWECAQKNKKLVRLGRINEFAYSGKSLNTYNVQSYALSGIDPVEYEFGIQYSKLKSGVPVNTDLEENVLADDGVTDETQEEVSSAPNEDISYQSTITGVTVWARVRLLRQQKRRKVRMSNVLEEVEREIIECQDQVESPAEGFMLHCENCGKLYRRQSAFESHRTTCDRKTHSNAVIDRAVRIAFEMLGTQDAPIYTTKKKNPSLDGIEVSHSTIQSLKFSKGWAKRLKYGDTLGINFVQRYSSELESWFYLGEKDKGRKMSASQMRSMLRSKYPKRYDLPGEHNITSYISGLIRKRKIASSCDTPSKRKTLFPTCYASKLSEILDENPDFMPWDARSELIIRLQLDEHALHDDLPSEASIRSKLSSLKARRKFR